MFHLTDYLEKKSVISNRYNNGTEWVIRCACDKERGSKQYHLWVNVEKQKAYCFRCQKRLDLAGIIQYLEGCTYFEADAYIRKELKPSTLLRGVVKSLSEVQDEEVEVESDSLPIVIPFEFIPYRVGYPAPKYLLRRIPSKDRVFYGVGWCRTGFYARRVVVPIPDLENRLVSFVARFMGDPPKGIKKVLYPAGSKISTVLFNHKRVLKSDMVVITEGIFDAMSVGSRAVALFGKHASRTQLKHLISLGETRKLYVMLDSDAVEDAIDLAGELYPVCAQIYIAYLPEGVKDPGEATKKQIQWAIENAEQYQPHKIKFK